VAQGKGSVLFRAVDGIDAAVDRVGRAGSWLILGIVATLFLQIPMREFVHYGHREVNDFGQTIHAAVFMIGASYALRWNAHVRVDIFYHRMSERQRALVDLCGTLFLILPWLFIVTRDSIPIVVHSVLELEAFAETYTPGYFILRSQLLVFAVLLAAQCLANILRDLATLLGHERPGASRGHPGHA